MAAPMCMVAHAEPTTVQEYAIESIDLINRMADILEKITPDTAEACAAEMYELKDKLMALKAAESKFSDEEKEQLIGDTELEEKMKAALGRIMQAAFQLQTTLQNAGPEDQIKLMKVMQAMQSINM